MQRRIARGLRRPRDVRVIPITIDADELAPPLDAENEFLRQFAHGRFTIVHTGNMGQKQDLDIVLRAAHALHTNEQIQFHVFGDGAIKQRFLDRRAELALDNVHHHPIQPRSMLRHILSGADVLIVTQQPEVVDIVIPSKMLTAMGAGAMIVAACNPNSEAARLLTETGSGILINAGDTDALVDVIGKVKEGKIQSAPFRERARQTALKHFDRRAVYGKIVASLKGDERSASGA